MGVPCTCSFDPVTDPLFCSAFFHFFCAPVHWRRGHTTPSILGATRILFEMSYWSDLFPGIELWGSSITLCIWRYWWRTDRCHLSISGVSQCWLRNCFIYEVAATVSNKLWIDTSHFFTLWFSDVYRFSWSEFVILLIQVESKVWTLCTFILGLRVFILFFLFLTPFFVHFLLFTSTILWLHLLVLLSIFVLLSDTNITFVIFGSFECKVWHWQAI